MTPLEIMKSPAAYASGYENTPIKEQQHAKKLCWEYNRTAPGACLACSGHSADPE